MTRQKTEAVKIQSSTADHLLNSKAAEHRQPALLRVRMTRENDEDGPRQTDGPRQRGDNAQRGGGDDGDRGGARGRVHQLVRRRGT